MPTQHLPTGIDLYYEVHGTGEPVVFIPGTGFAADVWLSHQVPELSKSMQVIIFDPRGVGRSTHYQGVYTIESQGCDVIALLDHLGVAAAHIVGHSMGGRVGLAMSLDFPGRVKSLILAASGSGPVGRVGEHCIPGLSYDWLLRLPTGGTEKERLTRSIMESDNYFTASFRKEHPDQVRAFYELASKRHAEWPEELRQVMARDTWEATHRLGDLVVPVLVVIGNDDTANVNHWEQARPLIERIPSVEHQVLEGQSHGFFWQAPEETNGIIRDWVQRHSAS